MYFCFWAKYQSLSLESLDAYLLSVVGHAFLEAVEESVVLEEVEVRVAVQVALPGVVVKLVDSVQGVDHFGGDVDKGLHAGEHPEAKLQQLGHRHGHVQQRLEPDRLGAAAVVLLLLGANTLML